MRYLSVLLVTLFTSTLLQAQEAQMRSEFVYCSLNPDKTMDDVRAQSQRYGEFSKAKGTKYAQAIMTPMHSGDTSNYDYILWVPGQMARQCIKNGARMPMNIQIGCRKTQRANPRDLHQIANGLSPLLTAS